MASRGISCFITSPPGVDRPRPTRVDSRRGKKKRKKRNERIHAPVDRRSREESGVVSFFLHYSRDVHLFPGLVDVAFSFRRLYAPTMDRRLTLKFRFCPRQFLFFSLSIAGQLLLRLLLPLCLSLTGKSFTSLVKLSHCLEFPCSTRLGHGLAGYRSNYLKPRHPTGRNIFFPAPVVVSVYCLVGSGVSRRVDVATLAREAFLSAYGVNLPRN